MVNGLKFKTLVYGIGALFPKPTEKGNETDLKDGFVYLIKERKPEKSFELFVKLTKSGQTGLCVTRQNPDTIKQKYGLTNIPIIWLITSDGEHNIAPQNLGRLSDTITNFITKNKNAVIIIDGIEYLITQNDFYKVLKALEFINENVMVTKSKLLLPIDPNAFEHRELALLERNMEVIK